MSAMSEPYQEARALINRAVYIQEVDEKPEEALPLFQSAVDLAPDWWETWQRLGSVLRDLKRYQEALDAYDRALGLVSTTFDRSGVLSFKASVLLRMERNTETVEVADQGLALREYVLLMDIKGKALLRLDRPAEALATYERSVAGDKPFYPGWVGKGQALIALRRYEEALEALNTPISMSSMNPDAWYYKAIALAKLGRYPKALSTLDTALKIQPDYPGARRLRQRLVKKTAADRQRGRDHRHGRLDDSRRDR